MLRLTIRGRCGRRSPVLVLATLAAFMILISGAPQPADAQSPPPPGGPATTPPQPAGPTRRPGFPEHGRVEAKLPTLNDARRSATTTFETPYGTATLTATIEDSPAPSRPGTGAADQSGTAAALAQTMYKTCSATSTLPLSSSFSISNTFGYDYSSVVYMGNPSYSQWSTANGGSRRTASTPSRHG